MENIQNIKAVFFDLDGTLIDSKKDITESVNNIRFDLNLEAISEEEVISHVGRGTSILLQEVLPKEIDFSLYFDKFIEYYKYNSLKYAKFYSGALELINYLKNRYKLALITNKSFAVTQEIIKKYDLESSFSIIYGGDSLPERKPSPLPLNTAREKLNLAKDEIVYFGDSMPDYEASKSAGIKCILATYGYGLKSDLLKCHDAYFINTPLELIELLESN